MITVRLKKGAEKPVRNGHPWIFSGAVLSTDGDDPAGSICTVRSFGGDLLGCGFYNENSSIRVRMLASKAAQFPASSIFERIDVAIRNRATFLDDSTDCCRLINSEGDFLPGLIIDAFGKGLVIQILTAGIELFRKEIIQHLVETRAPDFIVERSDSESRTREGLSGTDSIIYGTMPSNLTVKESGLRYSVDIQGGQKTGFFLDQRFNRALIRNYAAGKNVCDCFCYSGGFTVNALAGNATHVTAVDISQPALTVAQQNCTINSFNTGVDFVCADIFKYLRETEQQFDTIILDPPKFARHAKEIERAARGYKDINLQAFKKIKAGGILFTFSCSGAVERRLFTQIVFSAASDSGRQIQVLHTLSAGADHPFNIAHQEGEYLKGLVLRVY